MKRRGDGGVGGGSGGGGIGGGGDVGGGIGGGIGGGGDGGGVGGTGTGTILDVTTEVANPEIARVVATTPFTRDALERKVADVAESLASSTILCFVGTFERHVSYVERQVL